MNQHLHRLVFSRRHGMLMAVAETSRASGKAGGGERRAGTALLLATAALLSMSFEQAQAQARPPVVFASKLPTPATPAANLPVANSNATRRFVYDPAKGSASADLAAAGRVSWRVEGNTGSFDQGSVERVVINWDSFNIGAGYKVHFTQDKDPTKYVSALNRIWSADPSVILGQLTADREVILLNANGVYFGRGARVDTGKFVATALNIADSVFDKGLRNVSDGSAVFSSSGTDFVPTNLDAAVSVEAGAELRSAAGGDVLLIAPRVVNQGRIETPGGQTVLAAGDKVYLMSSSDPAQRGLIVAVDPVRVDGAIDTTLGLVENSHADTTTGLVNQLNEIRADSGSVNLVGLTVRQNGTINATTAVKGANGAIYLQAMASTTALPSGTASTSGSAGARGLNIESGAQVRVGADLGTVEIGAGSVTAVRPDSSAQTQIDAEVFNPSRIRIEGQAIAVGSGATIAAPAGKIELLAATSSVGNALFDSTLPLSASPADGSRIVIAPDAGISAAGLRDVEVDGARNQGTQRLFRIELADAPVQRSGPLYRSQVYFDQRDGSQITAADVSGAAAAIGRTASERSTGGGTLRIESAGTLLIGKDASLDVSGGSVHYGQTVLLNSLVERNGHLIAFQSLAAGTAADSLLTAPQRVVAPAYTEGQDGGTLQLNARQLVLADAALHGGVVTGERQRDGSSARATPALLEIGRGQGTLQSVAAMRFEADAAPAIDAALFADPLHAALDTLPAITALPLAQLADSGFGRIALHAGQIDQAGGGTLDLGVGGALTLQAGQSLSLNGSFSAAGGNITLRSEGDLLLSGSTRLDVAGLWTNDTAGAGSTAAAPVQLNGGSIDLKAVQTLDIAAGAALDVSAGAWLKNGGSLKQGQAGTMTLAGFSIAPTLSGVALSAFDFSGGGALSLSGQALTIAATAASGSSDLTLAPVFFSEHGFGTITLNADGDVRLASGTQLAPRLLNWELGADHRTAASGAMRSVVATPQPVDTQLAERQPVNLALNANRDLFLYGGGSVVVERGAAITLEPGAALSLTATRNIEIGASGGEAGQTAALTARGGSIALTIAGRRGAETNSEDPVGFIGDQALWLGNDARLDVSGIALLRPDAGGALLNPGSASAGATPAAERVTGRVLGGGNITLNAQRGYVVAEQGSAMLLDGASAQLNLPGLAAPVTLARSGGALHVATVEGFALDGQVSAHAPTDAAGHALADGGRFSVDLGAGGNLSGTSGRPYPDTRFDLDNQPIPGAAEKVRTISVGAHDNLLASRGVVRGDDLSAKLDNGIGHLRTTLLTQAGFDQLRLAAGDSVRFDTSVALDMALGVQIDAPAIAAAPGVQVDIRSAYAQLGDASLSRIGSVPDRSASTGTAQLSVTAATIELAGSWGLQGFANVLLDAGGAANGEIRLTAPSTLLPTAALAFGGRLELAASQVYATSGSLYGLNGLAATGADDAGSTLIVRTGAGGAAARAPLSAFGALAANATTIEQRGVLHQPFGSITLQAERDLLLGDGSLTSVSGQGVTVPYGTTANLSRWTLPNGAESGVLPRDKSIRLGAQQVLTAATATVDASGGGTVQASEFFAGVGGSSDYFDTAGLYAVLPDHAATQALALDGGTLGAAQQGRQIVITTAGSGLAPGRYTLLPARYALIGGALPQGAFLVSRAADQGSSVLTQALAQDDGSVVVGGYLTQAGSVAVGAPGERFVVAPRATALAKSEIRLSDVSALLATRAATLGAGNTPVLPRDAGQVQVTVSGNDTGRWQAQLDLRADGGLAGQLDISATRLALVDDLAKTPEGALGIDAGVVANSGAGSVLLGGRRTLVGSSWTIDASATTAVSVDLGTQTLRVEELLLAAHDSVSLAAGTQLAATGSATLGARTLSATGDGALLAVSANALDLQRSGATLTGGSLAIGADTVLAGRQVSLDTSGVLQVDGSTQLQTQALGLGARRIVVGSEATADVQASVLTGDLLSAVRRSADLSLRGYDSIDFVGKQDWSQRSGDTATVVASRLVLDTPALRGLVAADGTAAHTDIAAQTVLLRNTTGRTADAGSAGQGSLVLQALPPLRYGSTGGLTLGPGALMLGFDDVALRSTGDIVLQGDGSTSAQNGLTLGAARLTAASGAQQSLLAAGLLRVTGEAGSRTLGERVGQGASVLLQGQTVQQLGVLDLPGGNLEIQAAGAGSDTAAISFGSGSTTSVAGFTLPGPEGFTAFGRAGNLSASAAQGQIAVFGTLDTSAAGAGDAGHIRLSAIGAGGALNIAGSAALRGHAGNGDADRGGRLTVDVATMATLDTLADTAVAGGITREFAVRVRSGDVALDSNVQAQRITLSADAGALTLGTATLNAASASGGVVQLAAGSDLRLGANAHIDARSLRAGANGGDVLLASTAGRVTLAAGAQVDASGDDLQDGRIVLRALRGSDNRSVQVDAFDAAQLHAGERDVEAVRRYSGIGSIAAGNSGGSTLGQTSVRNDNSSFMSAKDSVLAALGVNADAVHLRAGVEVVSSGNLTVNGDWALNADRAGGDAGVLTLRAAGNLLVNGSISDGFSTATAAGVLNDNTRSWSYRLAAGADLTAADPLAVRDRSGDTAGDLLIGANRLVRTGAGSIEMAAGRDIGFASGAVAYVAGRKAAGQADLLSTLFAGQAAKPTFTEQGGRLQLDATRDIVGTEATQLVNNWLWRSGIASGESYANSSQLAWWTEFSRFRQTLGSFGGGDLTLNAGRDIVNVQAMAPSAGWADSKLLADAALQVVNGGDLSVNAGRDILGGQYLLGRGDGHLRAEGDIGAASGNLRAQTPLLALLDGRWDVAARGDLAIGAAFDATAVPVSSADNRAVVSPYFYSWDGDAALRLSATAGNVHLFGELDTGAKLQAYGLGTAGLTLPQNLFQVLPASLQVSAASGDVGLFTGGLANALLFPSTAGALDVWAGRQLNLGSSLAMADTSAAAWPDFAQPVAVSSFSTLIGTGSSGLLPGTLSGTLPGESLHAADTAPVRLHAEGTIAATASQRGATLVLPKAAVISAGDDILGLQLEGQNLHAGDTTIVSAGRNLLAGAFGNITLAGPGALEVSAGRQVDLENSLGISSTGNVRNAGLPAQGAAISLRAATAGTLDLAALDAAYLQPAANPRSQQHRDLLLASVRASLQQPDLSFEQAWALFQTFPPAAQAAVGRQVLAAEFGAVYLSGTPVTTAQMQATLQAAFERRKAELLQAGADALAAGSSLTLPGREVLQGAALSAYLAELRGLAFGSVDIDSAVAARVASLAGVQTGWRDSVAASLGSTAATLDALPAADAAAQAWRAALQDFSGHRFERYRQQVLALETASAGAAASQYGRKSLPMRLALFDQGFQAAELAGAGSFVAQPLWTGNTPLFAYTGALDMTQSSVLTERGGDISLVNAGGAINVGLKDSGNGAKGVIALGGGDVFGFAKNDFQVNNQRVFIVGQGDMTIWSSAGDIDSGRGANTAVAAPPLVARRSSDGVVFEVPATTTGSGLGILEDAGGRRVGSIGLFPAFGEILALDAFIRAPSVVLGATIRGADNLQAASVGGAAAPVSAPVLAVAPPPAGDTRAAETPAGEAGAAARQRNSLLTVELLGLGAVDDDETCSEQDERDRKCRKPRPPTPAK